MLADFPRRIEFDRVTELVDANIFLGETVLTGIMILRFFFLFLGPHSLHLKLCEGAPMPKHAFQSTHLPTELLAGFGVGSADMRC